jgi:hypothetical protein
LAFDEPQPLDALEHYYVIIKNLIFRSALGNEISNLTELSKIAGYREVPFTWYMQGIRRASIYHDAAFLIASGCFFNHIIIIF